MSFVVSTTPIITIKQPWAALVATGAKTIETRTHSRFSGLCGKRIYIHAGLGHDRAGDGVAAQHLTREQLSTLTHGAIIATAMVAETRPLNTSDERNALVECSTPRFGLILTDVTPIVPIPAKGKLGIWYLGDAA